MKILGYVSRIHTATVLSLIRVKGVQVDGNIVTTRIDFHQVHFTRANLRPVASQDVISGLDVRCLAVYEIIEEDDVGGSRGGEVHSRHIVRTAPASSADSYSAAGWKRRTINASAKNPIPNNTSAADSNIFGDCVS
jgi:hypothetical protein